MILLQHIHINKQIISAIMNLLTCILIAIPIGSIFIMLWIYNDYRKYKKKNKLAILLFLLFPTTLSAQYVDAGCQVSFKWLENQKGKLEYTKDGVAYKFIPNDSQWEIIICNNSSEDIRINWENMQFIVDGRTSEVKYPILAEAETPFAIIKSQAETSQKIGVTTYTANNSQIYNKKDIRKGRNSSISFLPFQFKMTIATFFILVARVYVSNVYGSIASKPDHARSFSLKVVRIAR